MTYLEQALRELPEERLCRLAELIAAELERREALDRLAFVARVNDPTTS